MNTDEMTTDSWNAVWSILVEECGASQDETARNNFLFNCDDLTEWRFCGALGFGGKICNDNERIYVSCYRKDETPALLAMIDAANSRLQFLLAAQINDTLEKTDFSCAQ